MLKRFMYLLPAIDSAIGVSTVISDKRKSELILSENEKEYLKHCLNIFLIFAPATTYLQGQNYPTI